jgi:hypothetical protein
MAVKDDTLGALAGIALLVLGVFAFALPSIGLPVFAVIAGVLALTCLIGIAADVYGFNPALWFDKPTSEVLQSHGVQGGTMPFHVPHTFQVQDLGQTDAPFEFQVVRDFDESEYDRTGKVTYLGPGFTRAEAAVIEWALTAVARGDTLCTLAADGTSAGRKYRGPTDLGYSTDA